MSRYSLSHLSDGALLRDLDALVARDRATTAELLAHLAEVDERKLYLPAAYPSMYAYCVGALGLSEDSAAKRIQVARAARRFPAIFEALAAGHLHLSGVVLLAPISPRRMPLSCWRRPRTAPRPASSCCSPSASRAPTWPRGWCRCRVRRWSARRQRAWNPRPNWAVTAVLLWRSAP